MVRRQHLRTAVVAFSVLLFTTLLFSYPYPDPQRYFQYLSGLLRRPMPQGKCACMGPCVADPGGDTWFSEHFNGSFHPLMTKESSALSEEVSRWWLLPWSFILRTLTAIVTNLVALCNNDERETGSAKQKTSEPQSSPNNGMSNKEHLHFGSTFKRTIQPSGNRDNYSHVMEELFSLFEGTAQQQEGEAGRCRRCALVGNSGNLKGSFNGRMIDSHDLVIRMNRAQTKGFEEHVGTRTTHHIMYPESAIDLGPDTALVLIPFKILDLKWLISAFTTGTIQWTYQSVRPKITANKEKVKIMNPAFMKYARDNWTAGHGRYPSTGFFSLMFALHMCDEVSVFGYGADIHGNWDHYWENNDASAFRRTGVHGGDHEYNITVHFARTHRVRMFPPPPPRTS